MARSATSPKLLERLLPYSLETRSRERQWLDVEETQTRSSLCFHAPSHPALQKLAGQRLVPLSSSCHIGPCTITTVCRPIPHSHLLYAEERCGGEEGGGHHHPVALIPEREGQEEVPEHQEAAREARVRERNGLIQDALAAANLVVEVGQIAILQG